MAFIYHCLISAAEKESCRHYSVTHIDWKWEFLGKALSKLTPLVLLVFARFSIGAIQGTFSDTERDAIVAPVARVIKDAPHFHVVCELYRVLGVCIEKYAKKLAEKLA